MSQNQACLAVMVKYPESGEVKTRLGRELGMDLAARVYSCFVRKTLQTCTGSGCMPVVSCHQYRPISDYRKWLGMEYKCILQISGDLGLKMQDCFEKLFELGYSRVVLAGSDIPQLSSKHIQRALEELDRGCVVVGPANDGGYYLLGMNKVNYNRKIFQSIPWSTPEVFPMTMKILESAGAKTYVLGELVDVDTLEDLKIILKAQGLSADNPEDVIRSVEEYLASV